MIKSIANISEKDYNNIVDILRETGQLSTDRYLRKNAKRWFIQTDNNRRIVAFAVQKKSRKKGYDSEIGYFYSIPDHRNLEEMDKFLDVIERNTKGETAGKAYITVVHPAMKRLLKNIGYGKIDRWDNDVDIKKPVELWTNDEITIVKDKEVKGYDESIFEKDLNSYLEISTAIADEYDKFYDIPEFKKVVFLVNEMPYKKSNLNPDLIGQLLIKSFYDFEYDDPYEEGVWFEIAREVFIGNPEEYPGDMDKEMLYTNLKFLNQQFGEEDIWQNENM
jgi:hypothetical protein